MFKGFDELPGRNCEKLPRSVIVFLSPRTNCICLLLTAEK